MCHVLIIEDDPLVGEGLADIPFEAGATSVHFAASPADALVSALLKPPAILFSDVHIGDGTGLGAVRAIREHLGAMIPVIFVAASPEDCDDLPFAAVLEKPVSGRELIQAFRSAGLCP